MLSSSTYFLLRILLSTTLPNHLTTHLLPLLHRLPFPFLFPPPLPNTPTYTLHHRLLLSLVTLLLLLTNLHQAIRSTPPNFYEILGVHPGVDEGGLKLAFRAFARKGHPDRVGVGKGGEEVWREVRDAYEALRDPVVRFAYDRFGADVLSWTQCTTTREYLRHGLMQSSGYHIVTGAGLLFFSAIGKPSSVTFWRYLLFAALFASELALLLSSSLTPSPSSPLTLPSSSSSPTSTTHPSSNPTLLLTLLSTLFPSRVAYQHILFLHQLFMFVSIALSRIGPVLGPVVREWVLGVRAEIGEGVSGAGFGQVVDRFGALVRAADRELYLMLHTELHSIQPHSKSQQPPPQSPAQQQRQQPSRRTSLRPITAPLKSGVIDTLTHEMENMIVENKLRKEAPLRSIWEAAVARGLSRERAVTLLGDGNAGGEVLSPPMSFREVSSGEALRIELGMGMEIGRNESPGRLPSPRPSPSPPPGIIRRKSSYTRARSVSC